MIKNGFTLAELLITMTIIGVISALVSPIIIDIMPDKSKSMFLKHHKEIGVITNKILDDYTLYYPLYSLDNNTGLKVISCHGLECTEQPQRYPFNSSTYSGNNKYPYLLANHLGIDSPNSTSFKTEDGTFWKVTKKTSSTSETYYNITM
jgi:prepilin-type N-terminal cleavage/methylation domain-containing protein